MLKELLGKKETSNLKQPCTYIYYYIKTSKTSTVLLEGCLYAGVSLHSLFEFSFVFFSRRGLVLVWMLIVSPQCVLAIIPSGRSGQPPLPRDLRPGANHCPSFLEACMWAMYLHTPCQH